MPNASAGPRAAPPRHLRDPRRRRAAARVRGLARGAWGRGPGGVYPHARPARPRPGRTGPRTTLRGVVSPTLAPVGGRTARHRDSMGRDGVPVGQLPAAPVRLPHLCDSHDGRARTGDTWEENVPSLGDWHRGFPVTVNIQGHVDPFLSSAHLIAEYVPVRRVRLRGLDDPDSAIRMLAGKPVFG